MISLILLSSPNTEGQGLRLLSTVASEWLDLASPGKFIEDHHVSQDESEIRILCEIPGFKILA